LIICSTFRAQDEDDEEGMLLLGPDGGPTGNIADRHEQWLAQKHSKIHSQRRDQVSLVLSLPGSDASVCIKH
jgi:hypothetical protein